MKQNKKGFTLLELLGVVIILGLLVTLILPSIINSIKKASNKTNNITRDLAINAADLYIKDNKNYYETTNGREFCISLSDLVNSNYLNKPLKYNDIDDITNTYSVKITYNDRYTYDLIENNSCPEPIYIAKETPTTGITPQVDEDGNIISGSEFEIKVSDEIGYLTFFVLSNDGKYVNLIAEQNITIDGEFTRELQDNDEWYITSSNTYDNRYGPQTAYTYLSTATSNWTNIPIIESFSYLDEGNQSNSSYGYQSIITALDETSGNYITTIVPLSSDYGDSVTYENMRARLPYYSEVITNTSCTTTSGSCPLWMVNYLYKNSYYSTDDGKVNSIENNDGYWLLASYPGNNNYVYRVFHYGDLRGSTNFAINGIRPVITVLKAELLRAM